MKKIIVKVLLVLLVLLVVYTLFNQFDAGAARFDVGEELDTSSEVNLLNQLFPTPSFDKKNGYYRMWTLIEPPGTDIEADEFLDKYRKVHDPQFADAPYIEAWVKGKNNWKERELYKEYRRKRKEILEKSSQWVDPPANIMEDWARNILSEKQYVLELKEVYQLLLDRYQKLVECEFFEDFTLAVVDSELNYRAPIPSLLAWLHTAKMYTAVNMLDALEGNWERGVKNLLIQVDFAKKTVKNGRTLILNLVGKAVARMTLRGLVSLMNRKECPHRVFEQVLEGLPPIEYEEFGSRKPLLAEGFNTSQGGGEGGLFLQENRTRQYYYDFFAKLYTCEKTPPYRWQSAPLEGNRVKRGWFWWLQNPGGKIKFTRFLDSKSARNLSLVILKSYALKTFYDMTRISAELHLNYAPDKPVRQILGGLETYKTLDPCSGKPYVWNEEKQIIYSLGTDRDDDGGKFDRASRDTDFPLPLILYVR